MFSAVVLSFSPTPYVSVSLSLSLSLSVCLCLCSKTWSPNSSTVNKTKLIFDCPSTRARASYSYTLHDYFNICTTDSPQLRSRCNRYIGDTSSICINIVFDRALTIIYSTAALGSLSIEWQDNRVRSCQFESINSLLTYQVCPGSPSHKWVPGCEWEGLLRAIHLHGNVWARNLRSVTRVRTADTRLSSIIGCLYSKCCMCMATLAYTQTCADG